MASKGVNRVIILGNLGDDPTVRYTQSGTAIANISVATSEAWTDKTSGEKKEITEWHRCVAYRRLAEIMGEYLRKGSKVYLEGRLQTRKWQDNDGNDKYTTEIVVSEMQMLDSREGVQQGSHPAQAQNNAPQQQKPNQNAAPNQQQQAEPLGSDFDDDIPY